MTHPNILLIVLDTARADAFEPYGAPGGSSPVVADLAAAGSLAPRVRAPACWTLPSHLSLFTGLLPRAAGFEARGGMSAHRSYVERLTGGMLPAALSAAGYDTLGLSTNLWISPITGFDRAFDEFEMVRGWRMERVSTPGLRTRARWYGDALRARVDDGAGEAATRLDRWVSRDRSAPFFCFVNLIECHSPYLPPRPFNPLGAGFRLLAAREARRHLNLDAIWRCAAGGPGVSGGALERMRSLYAASVRQLDDWLGRVLEMLERRGLLADTQVVVTSDHGENLGEDDLIGHAFSLDERLLRVPLVTAGPARLPDAEITSLAGLPGWLAELAGLGEQRFPAPPSDVAVAQFDAPVGPGDPRVAEALARWGLEGTRAQEARKRLTTSFACAAENDLKLVRRRGREELFDLASDPLEQNPVVVGPGQERTHGSRLTPLREALDRAESGAAPDEPGPEASADGSQAEPASAEERARLEEQMRLLGYL